VEANGRERARSAGLILGRSGDGADHACAPALLAVSGAALPGIVTAGGVETGGGDDGHEERRLQLGVLPGNCFDTTEVTVGSFSSIGWTRWLGPGRADCAAVQLSGGGGWQRCLQESCQPGNDYLSLVRNQRTSACTWPADGATI